MVENGGHGSSVAAPMARKMMDYWLLGKLPSTTAPVIAPSEESEVSEDSEDSVRDQNASALSLTGRDE
jgi:penicillin-binding protein 2